MNFKWSLFVSVAALIAFLPAARADLDVSTSGGQSAYCSVTFSTASGASVHFPAKIDGQPNQCSGLRAQAVDTARGQCEDYIRIPGNEAKGPCVQTSANCDCRYECPYKYGEYSAPDGAFKRFWSGYRSDSVEIACAGAKLGCDDGVTSYYSLGDYCAIYPEPAGPANCTYDRMQVHGGPGPDNHVGRATRSGASKHEACADAMNACRQMGSGDGLYCIYSGGSPVRSRRR